MKSKARGFQRLLDAAGYSWHGIRAAWRTEAAIRQEVLVLMVLLPCVFFFNVTAVEKAVMLFSALMVLVVELLNTAIETVVDRIGAEFHELSGKAKDVGSAAVLVCLSTTVLIWFVILLG